MSPQKSREKRASPLPRTRGHVGLVKECGSQGSSPQSSLHPLHHQAPQPDSVLHVWGREKVFPRGGGWRSVQGRFPVMVAHGDRIPAQKGIEGWYCARQILGEVVGNGVPGSLLPPEFTT